MLRLIILLIAFSMSVATYGDLLLAWDFQADSPNGNAVTVDNTSGDANMETATFSRGSGMNVSSWPVNFPGGNVGAFAGSRTSLDANLAAAITANAYFSFTATASAGYQMSLSTLDFYAFQQNNVTLARFELLYSVDGGAFASAGAFGPPAFAFGSSFYSADLSGVSALQNVSDSVEFRFYNYQSDAYGSRGLGLVAGANNDVVLNGTTSVVPEPSMLALVLSGFAIAFLRRRGGR